MKLELESDSTTEQELKPIGSEDHQDDLIIDEEICSAFIEEITSLGEATVKFSTPMKTQGHNLT